jgi:hypothetical protein
MRSSETYRSIVAPSIELVSALSLVEGGMKQHTGLNSRSLAKSARNLSATDKSASGGRPPLLVCNLERFPLRSFHALLRGPYATAYEAVESYLRSEGNGIYVQKMNKEKGKFKCVLDQEEFKM